MRHLGIVGGGAWGTALAQVCARASLTVTLWAREPEVVAGINTAHENPLFLPGVGLDPAIAATADMAALGQLDMVLAVSPAQHLRSGLAALAPHARPGLPIVLCAKGVEQGSLKLMTQVLAETVPEAAPAVLSGPSFAGEVARGLPTAVTLACPDPMLGQTLAAALATPTFRPYIATDMIGAEAGGAVKNVLAIACGVVEGRGLGRSAHAALITRGFSELTRLAVALRDRGRPLRSRRPRAHLLQPPVAQYERGPGPRRRPISGRRPGRQAFHRRGGRLGSRRPGAGRQARGGHPDLRSRGGGACRRNHRGRRHRCPSLTPSQD
jgi:glycerol-3-phosphate dehydrogenase (NAD(P)+)